MSVRTRLGFAKTDLGGGPPLDRGPAGKSARTVAGHALGVTAPAGRAPPEEAPGPDPGQVTDPRIARAKSARALPVQSPRSGKSGFSARAGFWGRRNSSGDLVPLTDPALRPPLPHTRRSRFRPRRLLQNLAVLTATAALSFLVVLTILELAGARRPSPPPRPRAAGAAPFAPLPGPPASGPIVP